VRALVTGGAGFVGSHLAEALLARGDEVLALDDLSTGARENVAALEGKSGFELRVASCGDPGALAPALERCDVVFHLAAAVGVDLIIARPVDTIEKNVYLTEIVLREAARLGRRFVFTSTSEVYGKGARTPFAEDDDIVLGPSTKSRWSYACSKLLDEFLALAYVRERGLRATILRLFNTVGPRQSGRHGMVLPRLVERALAGKPLEVYGDGRQSRCFCDVRDVVRGLLAAADAPAAEGEVINLGGTEEVTILGLAERVKRIVNPAAPVALVPYEKAYAPGFEDMRRRVPDIAKAARLLNWAPTIGLDETIRRIAEHMMKGTKKEPRIFTDSHGSGAT
jgi:UDP-glucose 4-epimerase